MHRDRSTHSDVSYETEFEAYFFSSRCFLNKKLWQSLFFVYICVAYMSDYFFLSFSSRARVFFSKETHEKKGNEMKLALFTWGSEIPLLSFVPLLRRRRRYFISSKFFPHFCATKLCKFFILSEFLTSKIFFATNWHRLS